MSTVFLRLLIVYFVTVFSIRMMGKRQIGELQMSELVTAFFLSELASYPVTNQNIPLAYGIIPVVTLICMEVILSFLSTKIALVRRLFDCSPSVLIVKGRLDQVELAHCRMTLDELFSQLRLKDVSDLSSVDYALLEPNGQISVIRQGEKGLQHLIIADGVINEKGLSGAGLSAKDLKRILEKEGLTQKEVFLLCMDDEHNSLCIPKEPA